MAKQKEVNPSNSTFFQRKEDVKHAWFILDAKGKTLGRFAVEVAKVLRGRHKPSYTPHIDCGDGVIIINADQIKVTGAKKAQKIYRYYTGHPGGLREIPYEVMQARKPQYVLEHAVKGMLPHNRLRKKYLTRLRIFSGEEHSLAAQQPVMVNV
ncbi:MAG: rplM [Chlamydiales bacterium]|jgi:large subunit ribosomal protein L13|nr:rplM [Chlamydiales bacterium]